MRGGEAREPTAADARRSGSRSPSSCDGGPLRLGVLADRIGTSDSASTRAVDALEAAGLAERVPDPQDGRAVLVAATEAGEERVAEARDRLRRLLGSSSVPLDAAEREQLVDLLLRLIAALEDESP